MTKCRFCGKELKTVFADLNMAPTVNNYIKKENRYNPEITYPLITYVCDDCKLVQTLDFNPCNEIFTEDYAYFSSYSSSWLEHSKKYVDMICTRLNLDKNSHVMEIASNDGYMLQYFKEKNIPHLGVEPCKSVADVAIMKGISTLIDFFTAKLGAKVPKSDLICMCNVLAHVPDINDFVLGIKNALKPDGTVTIEFPHLLNIIKCNQFDTIYHEHYSYLSLIFAQKLFEHNDLKIYDVEELSTHGGSLRIYGCHKFCSFKVTDSVKKVLEEEKTLGLHKIEAYDLESGYNSMTKFICAKGFNIGVVGADSKLYDKENWHQSKTFRTLDTSNLIISDKQTEIFNNLSEENKVKLCNYTWDFERNKDE